MPKYVSPLEGVSQGLSQAVNTLGQALKLYDTTQAIRQQRELYPLQLEQAKLGLQQEKELMPLKLEQAKIELDTSKMQHGLTQMEYSRLLQPFNTENFKKHPLYSESNVRKFNDYLDNLKAWAEKTPYKDFYITPGGEPTEWAWQTFKKEIFSSPEEIELVLNNAIFDKQQEIRQYTEGLRNIDKKIAKEYDPAKRDELKQKKIEIEKQIKELNNDINFLNENRIQLAPIKELIQYLTAAAGIESREAKKGVLKPVLKPVQLAVKDQVGNTTKIILGSYDPRTGKYYYSDGREIPPEVIVNPPLQKGQSSSQKYVSPRKFTVEVEE